MKFPKKWHEKVISVLTYPDKFFKKMPVKGGYKDPLTFAAINISISSLLTYILISLGVSSAEGFVNYQNHNAFIASNLAIAVAVGLVGLYVSAGLSHIGMRMVSGKGKYEGTFRATAYSTAISLLSWINLILLGPIFAIITFIYMVAVSVYGIYITITGLSKVHKTSKARALGGYLIGIAILFAAMILIMGAVGLIAFFFLRFNGAA